MATPPEIFQENQHTEFKQEYSDTIKRTLVAFANTEGGTLYVGIDDNGNITGINNPDQCMRQITQTATNSIHPDIIPFIKIEATNIENKTIVTTHVQRGTKRPYYLIDKGIRPAGVYIRSGAASIQASEATIIDMIKETAGDSFEDAISLDQKLTFTVLDRFFIEAGLPLNEYTNRTLGLINSDNLYTNLAWLLSDQCTVSIKVAEFKDNNKEIFQNRAEYTGSLLQQFDQIRQVLSQHNTVSSFTDTQSNSMRRIDNFAYPPEVLREALLNLIVHRDYAFSAPGLISIFDNTVEFINLGGLPAGLSKEDMMNGISMQRNPKLANILYRLHLIEAYGTGIRRIMSAYSSLPQQPVFAITDHTFKVTVPMQQQLLKQKPQLEHSIKNNVIEQQILTFASRNNGVTRLQVQELTGLSQASAYRIITTLTAQKKLIKTGNGPSTKYVAVVR